jgi:hypothetical protein
MSMNRVVFTLALCLVWQSSAFAYLGSAGLIASDEHHHERMHREMQPHHHAADGALEFDDSVASLLHMMSDTAGSAALVPSAPVQLLRVSGVVPPASMHRAPPLLFLEDPLRPPEPSV